MDNIAAKCGDYCKAALHYNKRASVIGASGQPKGARGELFPRVKG